MKISNSTIKKLVKERSNMAISDSAAEAIARLLEKKAKIIAKYAVQQAGKKGRKAVTAEDIASYKLKFGD